MRTALPVRGVVILAALAASAGAQPASPERVQLAAFERALDNAVRGLGSAAHWQALGAPQRTRGYLIEGYGAMFVVPPRVLSSSPRRIVWHAETGPGLEGTLQDIEEGLHRIESPEVRAALGRTLQGLRQEVRVVTTTQTQAEAGPAQDQLRARLAAARAEEEQARLAAQETAQAARDRRAAASDPSAADEAEQAALEAEVRRRRWTREVRLREAELRGLESEVEAFRLEAERGRREAERRLREVSHEVHVRFGSGDTSEVVEVTGAPVPWAFWFETRPSDEPESRKDRVEEVREAVTLVLESHGPRLDGLGPDDVVAVAVDFVPLRVVPGAEAERTLVLRVRRRELQARLSGELSAAALRERIEISDY